MEDIRKDYKNIILISLLLFIPGIINNLVNLGVYKQYIIGSVVNMGLFICSYKIDKLYKNIIFSMIPSLSNLVSGFLFGNLGIVSIVMLPMIWMGNLVLIYTYKKYNKVLLSVISKCLIIYISFIIIGNVLNINSNMYNMLSKSFGYVQLITGMIGYSMFYITYKKSSK